MKWFKYIFFCLLENDWRFKKQFHIRKQYPNYHLEENCLKCILDFEKIYWILTRTSLEHFVLQRNMTCLLLLLFFFTLIVIKWHIKGIELFEEDFYKVRRNSSNFKVYKTHKFEMINIICYKESTYVTNKNIFSKLINLKSRKNVFFKSKVWSKTAFS